LDTGYDINHVDLPGGVNNPDTTSEVSGGGTCNNCPWNRDSNSHGTSYVYAVCSFLYGSHIMY